ncbi:MAG: Repeat family, partial [Herbinix sp.]|nr:Repeat family [Herbinix sp.]
MKKEACTYKYIIFFVLIFVFTALVQSDNETITYAASFDTELLVNGGGESGGGWTAVADGNDYTWGSTGGGRTGKYWAIWALGYFASDEECYQIIDVSNLDFSSGNAICNFNGYYKKRKSYVGTYETYENYIKVRFDQLDMAGNTLSFSTSTCSVNDAWQRFSFSETLLSNTKKLKVTLSGKIWGEGGGNQYVGFDDMSLKVSEPDDEPPTISLINDQSMDSGDTLGPISFTAEDPEAKPMTLTVTSSNPEVISNSNIVSSLSGGIGSILLTSTSGMTGTSDIAVTVSDGVRFTTERFMVTVFPNLQIGSNMVRNGDGSSTEGWINPQSRFLYGSVFQVATLGVGASSYFMYQDIDIRKFSTLIDTGLAEFTSSCNTGSGGSYSVVGLDGSGNVLWTSKNGSITSGTRIIRVTVGGPLNATIDNVNITIKNIKKMSTIPIQNLKSGTSLNDLPFTVIYQEEDITLTAASDNQDIIPNGSISFGGVGYQRTISFTTLENKKGSANISVMIDGSTMKTFLVNVYTNPGAPSGVAVTDVAGGMSVSFTPPSDNGGSSITSYEVTSIPGSITAIGSGSPILIKGLTIGTSYTFTVKAINKAGAGPSSSPSGALLMTGPPTMGSTTVSNIKSKTADVTAEVLSDGSSPVTERGIEYKKSSDSFYHKKIADTNGIGSFLISLTELSINTQYDVRAYATNGKSTTYGYNIQFTTLNNTNPIISSITSPEAIEEDGSTSELNFIIGDVETLPENLTVTAISDNTSLVPNSEANLVLSGSNENRTIKIIPNANQYGSVNITVTVTDQYEATAGATFQVNVNAVNDAPAAIAGSLDVTEDTLQNGTLSASDIDGD